MRKGFQDFFGIGCGSTDFGDDDPGGMVGQDGGFLEGGSGRDGGGQGSDNGITRAGNVKNFSGKGGYVDRRLILAAEEHSLFSQGDEDIGRGAVPEENLRYLKEFCVLKRLLRG